MTPWTHTPLTGLVKPGRYQTAGRLVRSGQGWALGNAQGQLQLTLREPHAPGWGEGALTQVRGEFDGQTLKVDEVLWVSPRVDPAALWRAKGHATQARAHMARRIRRFFDQRGFCEVQTPCWVQEPGTDVHLDLFESSYHASEPVVGYLQTSPELEMKQLLCAGHERIYQLTRAWRNGELTELHQPEFTILEWYRAWEPLELLMDEVEDLTRQVLEGQAQVACVAGRAARSIELSSPFERVTMQQLFERACGFDLLEHLTLESLQQAVARHLPQVRLGATSWDELFFALQVGYLDPYLERQGAMFVTSWPKPLAVLARQDPEDPRVARRFELYLGGVELANGFDELTDPVEQRARFTSDLEQRARLGLPQPRLPERFLRALEGQMPPAVGVAVGVDRLLMLRLGAKRIQDVIHGALERA